MVDIETLYIYNFHKQFKLTYKPFKTIYLSTTENSIIYTGIVPSKYIYLLIQFKT